MNRVTDVIALSDYRLWLRFGDQTEGEVDLSDLVGKGVFRAWDEPGNFESVRVGPGGSVAWGEDIELCPDSLYLKITGKRPEEIFPPLAPLAASA